MSFDHSTNHDAYADDALNVNHLNLNCGFSSSYLKQKEKKNAHKNDSNTPQAVTAAAPLQSVAEQLQSEAEMKIRAQNEADDAVKTAAKSLERAEKDPDPSRVTIKQRQIILVKAKATAVAATAAAVVATAAAVVATAAAAASAASAASPAARSHCKQ